MRKVEEEETENAEQQLCLTIGHWPCAAQGSNEHSPGQKS